MLQALLYQASPLPLYAYPHGSQLPSPPAQMLLKTSLWLPHSVILLSVGGRDHWSSCKNESQGVGLLGIYTQSACGKTRGRGDITESFRSWFLHR